MKSDTGTFQAALVTLDLAMREKGHLWIYGSDTRETTILVFNRADHPDVPARWGRYEVRQRRLGGRT
jgi:hypothetical protein